MKMKITKKRFLEILEEELKNVAIESKNDMEKNSRNLADLATKPAKAKGKLMPESIYEYESGHLTMDEKNMFGEAYILIKEAVENGALPESVEDAVHEMLYKLGIYY